VVSEFSGRVAVRSRNPTTDWSQSVVDPIVGRSHAITIGAAAVPPTMNFDDFTGQVQHRLELPATGEAVRAVRATLTGLGRRIPAGDATDLASSLPMEIDWYLTGAVHEHGQRFDWQEFVGDVADAEGVDRADAAYHAQVVFDLVASNVPEADVRQLRDQLPADDGWDRLFEVVDAGGYQEHDR
jgi:uncharacterized protein (DUF2267 family)